MRILGILAVWLLLSPVLYGKMPYDAVCVLNRSNNGGGGSGTLIARIGDKGLILSEAHVFHAVAEVEATWPAFKVKRTAKPVYVSYLYDTALLVVDNPPCEPVSMGLELTKNQIVYMCGFPWYSREKLHLQKGKLDEFFSTQTYSNTFVLTSCRPAGGMSGGPAFNEHGSLIGSVQAVQSDGTGGVIVANTIIVPIVMAYTDPETWVPITSHIRKNWKGKSAERERTDLTEEYDESTAPDLIETKVPVK